MIKEYFEIWLNEVKRHSVSAVSEKDRIGLEKRLRGLFAFNNRFYPTEAGAYQQVIRDLQKEIEEFKTVIAAWESISISRLETTHKIVDEKKALEKKIQDYSEPLKAMEAQAVLLLNGCMMEMRRRQDADVKIEEMKIDMERKQKLEMEMVKLCRKRRLKIEGMEKEITELKEAIQIWRSNSDEWKGLAGKWEQDYLTLKEKLQKEINSLRHDKMVLMESTAEHIIEIVDLKKENKDKDAYYAGLLRNKDEEIIDLKIRLSIANAVQGFTDYLYRLDSKKTTKTENV